MPAAAPWRRANRVGVLVAVLLAAVGGPGTGTAVASAPDATSSPAVGAAAARARILARAGEPAAAAEQWIEVYRLTGRTRWLVEAAAQFAVAERWIEVHRTARQARLALPTDSTWARRAAELERTAQEHLKRQFARLVVEPTPRIARVSVDGQPVTPVPVDAWLPPGTHTVRVEADGYVPYEAPVTLQVGATVRLTPGLSHDPAATAVLDVDVPEPDAVVEVDGRVVGRGALGGLPLEPGPHWVRVSLTGRRPWAATVDAVAGHHVRLEPRLTPIGPATPAAVVTTSAATGGTTLRTWGWVLLGTGLAVGAAGGVFEGLAWQAARDAEALDPTPPEGTADPLAYYDTIYVPAFDDARTTAQRRQRVGIGLLAAGGAVAATGVVLLVLDHAGGRTADDEAAAAAWPVHASVWPTAGGVVATARLTFR